MKEFETKETETEKAHNANKAVCLCVLTLWHAAIACAQLSNTAHWLLLVYYYYYYY